MRKLLFLLICLAYASTYAQPRPVAHPERVPAHGQYQVEISNTDTSGIVRNNATYTVEMRFADQKIGIGVAGKTADPKSFISLERIGPHLQMDGLLWVIDHEPGSPDWVFICFTRKAPWYSIGGVLACSNNFFGVAYSYQVIKT